jgi:hypothetical protein
MMVKLKFYLIALFAITSICPLFAQTWSPPMRVSPEWDTSLTYYAAIQVGITTDSAGTLWCGWCAHEFFPLQYNIYVSHYSDTTWSDPDTIYPFTDFWSCDLATDADGNVWVVAEEDGISACFYDGSSWSNLMAVPTSGSCCHYPTAAGNDSGNLWVCWASGGPGDGHHVWGNAYTAGQWGSPVLISYPGSHNEFAYSMTTDKQGRVWVGWHWLYGFDGAIYASFNDGSTWNDTMVIAEYSTLARGPALTADTSGKIWAGWSVTDYEDSVRCIYASYYDGNIWSTPLLIFSEDTIFSSNVAITSDDADMVWLTWVNSDFNIYYIYWNGSNWSIPAPVDTHPAKDYYPKMTFDGERIWVVWIREVDVYGWDTLSVYASYTYGVGVEEKPVAKPLTSALGLRQNYPNPFSTNTTISYQLPSACYVSLKLYDITGELVRTLVSRHQEAGRYAVSWDGTDNHGNRLPAGVYFLRCSCVELTESLPIVLLR